MLPPKINFRRLNTHRLIPSCYRPNVLSRLVDDTDLPALHDIEGITNDRLLAEQGRHLDITPIELVHGVANSTVINASFAHPHPTGSRFSDAHRGAWYAGFERATSLREIIYHRTQVLAETQYFNDTATYDDFLADFAGQFHDLRQAPKFAASLAPNSYTASQALAKHLRAEGSLGVIYPSVRAKMGTCLACFIPAAVAHVRRTHTWELQWSGSAEPKVRRIKL